MLFFLTKPNKYRLMKIAQEKPSTISKKHQKLSGTNKFRIAALKSIGSILLVSPQPRTAHCQQGSPQRNLTPTGKRRVGKPWKTLPPWTFAVVATKEAHKSLPMLIQANGAAWMLASPHQSWSQCYGETCSRRPNHCCELLSGIGTPQHLAIYGTGVTATPATPLVIDHNCITPLQGNHHCSDTCPSGLWVIH